MAGNIEVEIRLQIKKNGSLFLRAGTIELLKSIDRTGSLRISAKEIHISYQTAWNLINELNLAASSPVVIKHRGGRGGGGAKLSEYGKNVLREFNLIEQEINKFITRLNREINF